MTNELEEPKFAGKVRPAGNTLNEQLIGKHEATPLPQEPAPLALQAIDVVISYGGQPAIKHVSLDIQYRKITAIIGPSGCGKSTLLRAFNRMNEYVPNVTMEGQILFHGEDLYAPATDPVEVRRRVGMVFQKPNPFPKSIFNNVSWGPKINGYKGDLHELVEKSLRQAALWDEVKDRLYQSALGLSGGAATTALHRSSISDRTRNHPHG
jgi:phosphate transport system ATP-binding protein